MLWNELQHPQQRSEPKKDGSVLVQTIRWRCLPINLVICFFFFKKKLSAYIVRSRNVLKSA